MTDPGTHPVVLALRKELAALDARLGEGYMRIVSRAMFAHSERERGFWREEASRAHDEWLRARDPLVMQIMAFWHARQDGGTTILSPMSEEDAERVKAFFG